MKAAEYNSGVTEEVAAYYRTLPANTTQKCLRDISTVARLKQFVSHILNPLILILKLCQSPKVAHECSNPSTQETEERRPAHSQGQLRLHRSLTPAWATMYGLLS